MSKAWLTVVIALKTRLEELRHTQEQNKEKPRYDRHCLHDHNHAADEPHVVRFKNPTEGSVVFDDAVRGRIEISNSELDDLIISSYRRFTNLQLLCGSG